MSEYHDSQLTAFGADLAQRASNGDTKFTITKATSTADDLSQTDLSQLITLPHEKQTGEIDRILPDPNGGTKVKGTKVSFDNFNVSESYSILAIGLYAKEDINGAKEQLYAVTTAGDPETMPKSDSTVMFTFSASIYVIVGNTSQVTINVNPDSFATKEYVADAIANINFDTSDLAKLSQNNYYTGDNQFKYDPVNKDGDAYGLAKNIDTKVTDNADGTITVNGKTYTPADDSKVVHNSDATNWQKSKITDDTGMPLLMLGDTDDLSAKISGLSNGYFTIYCTAKTLNNPSASPKRGIIHITASRVAGSGILFSEDKNAYIITMLNGTVAYTKIASDSTVVHNSGNETIGDTKTFTNPIKGTIDGITYRYSAQGDDLNTSYMNDSVIFVGGNSVANAPAGTSGIWAIVRNYNSNATNGAQSYYDTNTGVLYVRTRNSTSTFTPWIQVADDSKVVHTADMRKPASDVVGLEDVPQAVVKPALASGVDLNTILTPGVYPFNAISFTNYIDNGTYWGYLVVTSEGNIVTQTACATGSGQPLYRIQSGSPASWSPWARMADDSKVAHLSGANNFDTVPTVNNNPLLLASSLPSDLARTSQQTNFTAGLQSGGVSVATSDDLKSVEESAWRELDLSGTSGIYTGKILIKIDQVNKYVYFIMNAQIPLNPYSSGTKIIDLSSVVTGLSSAHGYLQGWIGDLENPYQLVGSTISTSGTCLTLGNDYSTEGVSRIATEADPGKQYCYAVYNSLVN